MTGILVFGNAGAGKSTYARQQCRGRGFAHLDLDTVAWVEKAPSPTRRPLTESRAEILAFIRSMTHWVIEGCYADLLAFAAPFASEMVFLNPGEQQCIANARNRPWEPHKYASPGEQDANLALLLGWIQDYYLREDTCSLVAHRKLFDEFTGAGREFRSNAWLEDVQER